MAIQLHLAIVQLPLLFDEQFLREALRRCSARDAPIVNWRNYFDYFLNEQTLQPTIRTSRH